MGSDPPAATDSAMIVLAVISDGKRKASIGPSLTAIGRPAVAKTAMIELAACV